MRKTKLFSLLFVLPLVCLIVSACSFPGFSRSKVDAKEAVTKAYEKLNSLENYHLSMDVSSSMLLQNQNVNTVMKGEMDIQKKPLLCKNILHIVSEMGAQKSEQTIEQYMEESGDQFIVYAHMNNQWMKQALPKNSYDPMEEYNNYLQAITKATLKSEDANARVFEVVASGSIMQEQIQKKMAAMGLQPANDVDEMFKDIGDLTYTVTVDKKTETISKIDIDISDVLAQIGKNMAEAKGVPEGQKKFIKDAFGSIKVKSSVTLSQFNSVDKIIVPDEAKK